MVAVLLLPSLAPAQVLERHLAPGLNPGQPDAPKIDNVLLAEDATPLGPALTQLSVSDAAGDAPSPPDAVTLNLSVLRDEAGLKSELETFLGRPISRRLLSQLTAAVTRHYRRVGLPFVAVSLPPQDITKGVVAIRVVPFRLGAKTVQIEGARRPEPAQTVIRAKPGQPIDADLLQQDLDWLNHSPFHTATAQFSPGAQPGDADLTVHASTLRPWQVFGGWSNTGAASSGYDRYFIGAQVGDLVRRGSIVAFQVTASDDVWNRGDEPFSASGRLRYISHSLTLALPVAPRSDVTVSIDAVQTLTRTRDFDFLTHTAELSAVYRTALSDWAPLPGEVSLGGEARGQWRETLFGGVSVDKSPANVFQALLGWSHSWLGDGARQSVAATLRFSPGGQGGRNSDAAYGKLSNGAAHSATYAYLRGDYAGDFPVWAGFRYGVLANLQLSDQALLGLEQSALGGEAGVRGYGYEDGAFDNALVVRNQLKAPLIRFDAPVAASVAPYLSADLGYGWSHGRTGSARGASLGGGVDFALGGRLMGSVNAAYALHDAPQTHADHFKVYGRVTLSY